MNDQPYEITAEQEPLEPLETFNNESLQYTNEVLQQSWNNVKERHKDTLQCMVDK